MGRGNVCVRGKAEGLFYVDNDFLQAYRLVGCDPDEPEIVSPREAYNRRDEAEFTFDETESELLYEDLCMNLVWEMKARFKSFDQVNKWISRTQRALLENELFYVALEDNEWSIAVELIQKEGAYGDELLGLQLGLYEKYLKAIKQIILDMYGEVGVYDGAWTHRIEQAV